MLGFEWLSTLDLEKSAALISIQAAIIAVVHRWSKVSQDKIAAKFEGEILKSQREIDKLEDKNAKYQETFERKIDELIQQKKNIEEASFRQIEDLSESNKNLRETLTRIKTRASAADRLMADIDAELVDLTGIAGVESSSILVPYPFSGERNLIFLSTFGEAAHKLKGVLVDLDNSRAGKVFDSGESKISNRPLEDTGWNPDISRQITFTLGNMMTLPLKFRETVGVVQFLNKNCDFTDLDKERMSAATNRLSSLVGKFVQNDENFEFIGLTPSRYQASSSVIVFDMSNSSTLLKGKHKFKMTQAVNLINEYLDRLTVAAIGHDCIVDKFMWDGGILSLNVVKPVANHREVAFKAAIAMSNEFKKLKEIWLETGHPVDRLSCRIAIASGPVLDVDMGPPQYRQKTVVGNPVVVASALCGIAQRDRNMIILERSVYAALPEQLLKPYTVVPQAQIGKAEGLIEGAMCIEA